MLRVDQVHVIRHKVLVEGRSERSVARDLGVSRTTVGKYVRQSEPRRRESEARRQPARERVGDRLMELWEEWSHRSGWKHRITGSGLWRQLRSEGFEVSEVTVRRMVRELRLTDQEVYIPLVHRPGDSCQVDFFEVIVVVSGIRRKVWLFLLYLSCSGRSFCRLYEQGDQLSFLDGHVRAFEHFGGLPARSVYDNLKAAVRQIVVGGRLLSVRFQALLSHYTLEACFARPGEGHDKGLVERAGQTIRLQHLTPIQEGESLAEISDRLQAELDKTWKASGSKEEPLRPLPSSVFDPRRAKTVTVKKNSTFQIEAAVYSLPTQWARRSVQVLVGIDEIEVSCGCERMILERVGRGSRSIRYRHYLSELARKPQATRQVAPELIRELGEPFDRFWNWMTESHGSGEAARVLSRLLKAVLDHGEGPVGEALTRALDEGRLDLLSLRSHEERTEIPVPEELRDHVIETTAATSFDQLLQGAA